MASNKEEKSDKLKLNRKDDLYHDVAQEKKKKLEDGEYENCS